MYEEWMAYESHEPMRDKKLFSWELSPSISRTCVCVWYVSEREIERKS